MSVHHSQKPYHLLLCDLCDSAGHTYCVGLGAIVPEGDWFCHDCAISRIEHEKLQKDNDDVTENSSAKMEVVFLHLVLVSTV